MTFVNDTHLVGDYVTRNGCGGSKRTFATNERMERGKSDERRVMKKGKGAEGADYLSSAQRKRLVPYRG